MAKSYSEAKGRSATASVAARVIPVKVAVPLAAGPTAETKVSRVARADRPACADARKEINGTDIIHSAKPYADRQGTLRANIVAAIQASKTVWDACKKEVNGPGKHAELAYTVKRVDVGFAIGNGYITVTAAK